MTKLPTIVYVRPMMGVENATSGPWALDNPYNNGKLYVSLEEVLNVVDEAGVDKEFIIKELVSNSDGQ